MKQCLQQMEKLGQQQISVIMVMTVPIYEDATNWKTLFRIPASCALGIIEIH